jgi:hypothetical protein
MPFGVTFEFKTSHHGITEVPFYELFVGKSTGEVLKSRYDSRM